MLGAGTRLAWRRGGNTLVVKLPHCALSGLKSKARESLALTLIANERKRHGPREREHRQHEERALAPPGSEADRRSAPTPAPTEATIPQTTPRSHRSSRSSRPAHAGGCAGSHGLRAGSGSEWRSTVHRCRVPLGDRSPPTTAFVDATVLHPPRGAQVLAHQFDPPELGVSSPKREEFFGPLGANEIKT